MTETEWLKCDEPIQMLNFLASAVSNRKARLLTCLAARLFWQDSDEISCNMVTISERYADGQVCKQELNAARCATSAAAENRAFEAVMFAALARDSARVTLIKQLPFLGSNGGIGNEKCGKLTNYIRDLFGPHPLRPIYINRNLLTSTVTNLATAAYEHRALPSGELDPTCVAVLTDALEDTGCDNQDILNHLRSPGPHVRGCHVLDFLLEKC